MYIEVTVILFGLMLAALPISMIWLIYEWSIVRCPSCSTRIARTGSDCPRCDSQAK